MLPVGNLTPFAHSRGRRDAKIALVGEAWGEQEELLKLPFMGASGQELGRILREVGIDPGQCFYTNVFPLRPPGNNIEALCGSKKEVGPGYVLPPIRQGKYIRPEYLPHLERLSTEIAQVSPNLVVPLGNIACWALLTSTGIGSIRGNTTECRLTLRADGLVKQITPYIKALPTYHPVAVLRDWSLRVIVKTDLLKAAREAEFPEIRRPERWVLIDPTLAELREWFSRPAERYAVDVETAKRQITMIGLARNAEDAVVVPFVDARQPHNSYWATLEEELEARALVNTALAGSVPKIFQNGLYDLQYIWREGFTPRNCTEDTMLLHHAMYPELRKGLGFLGSVYTNESSWKLLRRADDSNKRDE
jgi:uracil-DNA glycosylase